MLFNTNMPLWQNFGKSSCYQPIRISPYGEIFSQSGSIIGRFSTKENAINTLIEAGWEIGEEEIKGYSGAIYKR